MLFANSSWRTERPTRFAGVSNTRTSLCLGLDFRASASCTFCKQNGISVSEAKASTRKWQYQIGDALELRDLELESLRITQGINIVGMTDDDSEISAHSIFGKTQTEQAAAAVKLGERLFFRVHHNLVRDGQHSFFQCHAGHAGGLSNVVGGVCVGVLSIVKGDQVTGRLVCDARAFDLALPPRWPLALQLEPHLK